MPNANLEVYLSLKDNLTANLTSAQKAIKNIEKQTNDFRTTLRSSARELNQVSSSLAFLSASIIGPLALAFKTSEKDSYAVHIAMKRLQDTFSRFQVSIAKQLIPAVEGFTDKLKILVDKYEALSPAIKKNILDIALWTGGILAASAVLLKLITIFMKLGAFLILLGNKFLDLISLLTRLLPLMTIFSRYEFGGLTSNVVVLVKNFGIMYPLLLSITAAFAGWKLGRIIGEFTQLDNILSGPDGLFVRMFIWLDKNEQKWKSLLSMMTQVAVMATLATFGLKKPPLPEKGEPTEREGQLEPITVKLRTPTYEEEMRDFLKYEDEKLEILFQHTTTGQEIIKNSILAQLELKRQEVLAYGGAEDAKLKKLQMIEQARMKLVLQTNLAIAASYATSFASIAGSLATFFEVAQGETKKYAAVIKAIRVVEVIMNTAAGIMNAFATVPWPASIAAAALVAVQGAIQLATILAQKYHKGGMIRAHEGLAVDEVPIVAQTGEGVLSRRGMDALGGAGPLNRLNAGGGVGDNININVNIEKASFREDQDAEETFKMLSDLIIKRRRSLGGIQFA